MFAKCNSYVKLFQCYDGNMGVPNVSKVKGKTCALGPV